MLAAIPSPAEGVWQLGPVPIRAYALAIIVGIILCVVITNRRWQARGGADGTVAEVAMWAVPFGILGGRLYHVLTTPQPYFGEGGDPIDAFKIWHGGLGIWGAVALGGVGAWIGCRRRGIPLPPFGDAIAPGLLVAQAVGRVGNYFNQELYGGPTDLPWGIEIDPVNRPDQYPDATTFHPTFAYEALWCLALAGFIVWADRRWRMGHGRVFALYVAGYVVGRFCWELLRTDPANVILGLRVNLWVSLIAFAGSVAYILVSSRLRPGREDPDYIHSVDPGPPPPEDAEPETVEV